MRIEAHLQAPFSGGGFIAIVECRKNLRVDGLYLSSFGVGEAGELALARAFKACRHAVVGSGTEDP